MTIPGIGYYSAVLIESEIGDIKRFPDSQHLCSYAGLVPSTHSSGGVTYHGRITKRGSKHLRWILTECTHAHIRTAKDSNVAKFYNKIARKKEGKTESYSSCSIKTSEDSILGYEGMQRVSWLRANHCDGFEGEPRGSNCGIP